MFNFVLNTCFKDELISEDKVRGNNSIITQLAAKHIIRQRTRENQKIISAANEKNSSKDNLTEGRENFLEQASRLAAESTDKALVRRGTGNFNAHVKGVSVNKCDNKSQRLNSTSILEEVESDDESFLGRIRKTLEYFYISEQTASQHSDSSSSSCGIKRVSLCLMNDNNEKKAKGYFISIEDSFENDRDTKNRDFISTRIIKCYATDDRGPINLKGMESVSLTSVGDLEYATFV